MPGKPPSAGALAEIFWLLLNSPAVQSLFAPWQDVVFLGDFNADCSYVRSADWPHIRLRTSRDFQWLIPDTADTTVTNTNCAYDR